MRSFCTNFALINNQIGVHFEWKFQKPESAIQFELSRFCSSDFAAASCLANMYFQRAQNQNQNGMSVCVCAKQVLMYQS